MSLLNDGSFTQADSQSSGSQSSGKAVRGPRPRLFHKDRCQADGCSYDLKKLPFYNRRNHICMAHKTADEYLRLGDRVRFCQRCGLAHPLADFDGVKRSCRKKLEKHNERRRKAMSTTSSAEIEIEGLTPLPGQFLVQPPTPSLPPPDEDLLSFGISALSEPAVPTMSTANSATCNERVCCASGDECVCCECDSDSNDDVPRTTAASPSSSSAVAGPVACPSAPPAATAATDRSDDLAADEPTDRDDSDAVSLPAGPSCVEATGAAVAAAAVAEAELAALRVTDAAMYAMLVHRQLMNAHMLLATADMVQRTRSALSFSRMDSSPSISPMVM